MENNTLGANETQARALAKYLRVSVRTARAKLASPPFWLRRIYAMHQALTPEQRAQVEVTLSAIPHTVTRRHKKLTLAQYNTKLEQVE